MPRTTVRRRLPALALLQAVIVTAALVGTAVTAPSASAATIPVPASPSYLPAGIEALQAYVGQSTCDPVAKPGVRAFADLLLDTYTDTTSLGIVRDCGIGGQSEHKEGRAFDWGVSVDNSHQVAEVNAVLTWLTKTDAAGNQAANVRRFGLMYMIWNKKIWKAYQISKGWQPYTGADEHTGHVHFSFGWSGAKKATSWWTGKVAPADSTPGSTPAAPLVPVRLPSNLLVLATYGSTVLKQPTGTSSPKTTADPAATKVVQQALEITADGDFGSNTTAAVKQFETEQKLTVDGIVDAPVWQALFPKPQVPFGALESATFGIPGTVSVAGWAADADTQDPIKVHVYVDGTLAVAVTAGGARPDVERSYPGMGPELGYTTSLTLPEGAHTVCAYAINVGPGSGNPSLGCSGVTVQHAPVGHSDALRLVPGALVAGGWTYDPDSADPVPVSYTVDGKVLQTAVADRARSDIARLHPAYGGDHGYSDVLDLAGVAEGSHTFCVVASNLGAGASTTLGCLTGVVRHTPFGSFDVLRQSPGTLVISGWAVEPDVAAPVTVSGTLDGTAIPSTQATLSRPDIARLYPVDGGAHGFSTTLPVPAGEDSHTVCLTFANVGAGRTAAARCRTLAVTHRPIGRFDVATVSATRLLTVKGWALDNDTTNPIALHVRVDGVLLQKVTASQRRGDLARAYPGYGPAHGFNATLAKALSPGRHRVCVYAINALAGSGNPELSCRTVTVR